MIHFILTAALYLFMFLTAVSLLVGVYEVFENPSSGDSPFRRTKSVEPSGEVFQRLLMLLVLPMIYLQYLGLTTLPLPTWVPLLYVSMRVIQSLYHVVRRQRQAATHSAPRNRFSSFGEAAILLALTALAYVGWLTL